ncbi:serine hydrolase domain-containing protein [Streptomyces apocyni]|uniref:serine hydrolase domain-containing protein n=1 Tax=Streptomyces apocyni TaxID=2654677 RepID=UPI0018D03AE3|nr:serine hydrolase domain-containing protein [Streptomyces apocyni]
MATAVRTVRATLLGTVTVTAVAALTAATLTAPAAAESRTRDHQPTQQAMDAAVADGVPGVAGQAVDQYGTWKGTSGVGNLRTGKQRSAHDRYRIASITKTFVATVLLQLQGEGKLDLDDTVEKWLPGVVHGNGHDGSEITVRQLLNHTSGIFDYTSDPALARKYLYKGFLKHRYDTLEPTDLVAVAMRHKPVFEPGDGWSYSNTNYTLAGMIIEKVTGRTYGTEIEQRVIKPLGLHATRVPGTEHWVGWPSSRAYSTLSDKPQGRTYDVTELNPSMAGAAGEMISDSGDLNRFFGALLGGELLPAKQLKEMKTTIPVEGEPNAGYGLGLIKEKLSCGKVVWGHSGGFHGSISQALTTTKGDHSLAFNFNGDWSGDSRAVGEAEFCGTN